MATAAVDERQLLKTLRWYDGFVIALANPGFLLLSLAFSVADLGGWGAALLWGIAAVVAVFITIGANLPWGEIWDNLGPALAVVLVLMLLARPLTVLVCLAVDRRGEWTREEIAFLAWTRETGVVAAALAGLMVALDVPDANLVVATVAVAIVVTLAVQTTTKSWLGHRLGLDEDSAA